MGRFAQHDPGFGDRRRSRNSRIALDFDEPRRRRRDQWIAEEDNEDEGEDWWLDLDEEDPLENFRNYENDDSEEPR